VKAGDLLCHRRRCDLLRAQSASKRLRQKKNNPNYSPNGYMLSRLLTLLQGHKIVCLLVFQLSLKDHRQLTLRRDYIQFVVKLAPIDEIPEHGANGGQNWVPKDQGGRKEKPEE